MNAIEPTTAALNVLSGALTLYGVALPSRLLLGTAGYPSPHVLSRAVEASRAGIVTASLRREQARGRSGERFLDLVHSLGVRFLPNTAGCRTAKEAMTTAQMAREAVRHRLGEARGHRQRRHAAAGAVRPRRGRRHPLARGLQGAALHDRGPVDCRAPARRRLPGADAVGRADRHRAAASPTRMRSSACAHYFPGVPLIIDAGIGAPSHAAAAMEMGYDARAAQHGHRQGRRSGAHGGRLCRGHRGGARGLRGGPDGGARHGRSRRRRLPARRSSTSATGPKLPAMSEVPVSGIDVFYPIVPDAAWLDRLVPLGVRTVQLRIKDAPREEVRREIAASLESHARTAASSSSTTTGARRSSAGRRLRPSRPGGSRRRRSRGHKGRGRAPRHLHPQRGGARRRRSPRSRTMWRSGPSTRQSSRS